MNDWRTNYSKYRSLLQAMLEKREDIRAYIGILLSLITVTFFGVFALRPTLTTIGELVSEINSQKQTLDSLNQKIKNLETAKVNLQKIKADLPVLDQALPSSADPHLVIRQMETLASREGIAPANISVGKTPILGAITPAPTASSSGPEGGSSGLQVYPFSFTFQGDAEKTLSFLNNLKTLRRLITIDEVTVNRKAQSGSSDLTGSSTLQLIISGDIPFYPK